MKLFICLALLTMFGACASLEKPKETTTTVQKTEVKKEVAYGGHCPMGLCHKKFVKGNPQYNVEYKGKIYHFSSIKAKNSFMKNIDKNIDLANNHWGTQGADKIR